MKKILALVIVSSLFGLAVVAPNITKHVDTTPQHIVLTKTNFVTMDFDVTSESVDYVIHKLELLDKSKPRYLYIRSPGGEVVSGLKLVEYLKSEKGAGVVAIAEFAASMAFVTLQATETRLIVEEDGVLMSHGIQGALQGSVVEIEKELQFMKKLENILLDLLSKRMRLTREELRTKHNPELWIRGVDEAVKANAIDGVASVSCSKEVQESKLTIGVIEDKNGTPIIKEVEVGELCPL